MRQKLKFKDKSDLKIDWKHETNGETDANAVDFNGVCKK